MRMTQVILLVGFGFVLGCGTEAPSTSGNESDADALATPATGVHSVRVLEKPSSLSPPSGDTSICPGGPPCCEDPPCGGGGGGSYTCQRNDILDNIGKASRALWYARNNADVVAIYSWMPAFAVPACYAALSYMEPASSELSFIKTLLSHCPASCQALLPAIAWQANEAESIRATFESTCPLVAIPGAGGGVGGGLKPRIETLMNGLPTDDGFNAALRACR